MTFLKFLFFKFKNTSANYWPILGLRIFVRLLGITMAIYLLNFFDSMHFTSTKDLYNFISTVFYVLFFVFLDDYLKSLLREGLKPGQFRWINILKWVPFIFTLLLIYLTVLLSHFEWPGVTVDDIKYIYNHVWPTVFVPNLSFIIITLLVFYASAILNRNKQLKEENDLTI